MATGLPVLAALQPRLVCCCASLTVLAALRPRLVCCCDSLQITRKGLQEWVREQGGYAIVHKSMVNKDGNLPEGEGCTPMWRVSGPWTSCGICDLRQYTSLLHAGAIGGWSRVHGCHRAVQRRLLSASCRAVLLRH